MKLIPEARRTEDRQKCTKGMYMFICVCLKYINAW
jgi:hypothetical protein